MLQTLDADEKSLLAEQRLEVSLLGEIRKYAQMPRPQPPEQLRGVKRARVTSDLDAQPSNDEFFKEPESASGHVIDDTLCQSHDVVDEPLEQESVPAQETEPLEPESVLAQETEPLEDTLGKLMTNVAEEPQAASGHVLKEPSGHDLSTTQTGAIVTAMSESVKAKQPKKRQSHGKQKLFDQGLEKLNLGQSQCLLKFSPSKSSLTDLD